MEKIYWKHRIKIREYPELSVSQTPQGVGEIEDNYYIREDEVYYQLDKAREEGRRGALEEIKRVNSEIYEGRTEILEIEIDNRLSNLNK